MDHKQQDWTRDEQLDVRIGALLAGDAGIGVSITGAEQVAREFARLAAEESPRMSSAARTSGLNALRSRAATKRAQRRPNPFAFWLAIPRWGQVAAIAIIVVLIANGVSTVAANSLPGSLLYPFKRFTEGGQLLLQNTNGQRAQLWMNFANTRLDEVQRLLNTGAVVDATFLDSVDESILRALSEIAGTRGDERVVLLQQLTQLAMRQQQIVDQLAQNASPSDRARLEQTAKLLAGVAGFAQSPDALNGSTPFQFLTPTVTPSRAPTETPTLTPRPTRTPVPSSAPTPPPLPTSVPPPALIPNDNDGSATDSGAVGSTNDNENADDNDNGNGNDNGNVNDNDNDNGNDNGNTNDNDNTNDNSGNDNDDNGDNSGKGNDNDNGGDDNSGNGNGGDDNRGEGNGNENGGDDNRGEGNGNENGGDDNRGKGNGDENGGDDNSGKGNGGDNDNKGGGGKNDNDDKGGNGDDNGNSGKGGG